MPQSTAFAVQKVIPPTLSLPAAKVSPVQPLTPLPLLIHWSSALLCLPAHSCIWALTGGPTDPQLRFQLSTSSLNHIWPFVRLISPYSSGPAWVPGTDKLSQNSPSATVLTFWRRSFLFRTLHWNQKEALPQPHPGCTSAPGPSTWQVLSICSGLGVVLGRHEQLSVLLLLSRGSGSPHCPVHGPARSHPLPPPSYLCYFSTP